MIKFQRGKDPKESISVGLRANATEIIAMSNPDPEEIRKASGELEISSIIFRTKIDDFVAKNLLESIALGKIPNWEEKEPYVIFYTETDLEKKELLFSQAGVTFTDLAIKSLTYFKGSYIKFHDTKYLIV